VLVLPGGDKRKKFEIEKKDGKDDGARPHKEKE
jgi:hypothetical protein